MIRVQDIAERCLALADLLPADTLPTGTKEWVADAIMGAIGEMRRRAPGRFGVPLGGVLSAPGTVNATVTAASPNQITLANETTVPNALCSVRLAGMASDATIFNLQGTAADIAPGYEAIPSGSDTVSMTVWHDAWRIADGGSAVIEEGMAVRVNGSPLEKVSGRDHAERMCGRESTGRRSVTSGTGVPLVWWLDRIRGEGFVGVYPMPGARMAIETRVIGGAQEVSADNVLDCSEHFDFAEDVARELWMPLAMRRYMGSPMFANAKIPPEIARQAAEAELALDRLAPKKASMPPWNSRRPGMACAGRRY